MDKQLIRTIISAAVRHFVVRVGLPLPLLLLLYINRRVLLLFERDFR